MTYIVIDVEGELHLRGAPATMDTVRAEVGGDKDPVRLHYAPHLRGWVGEASLVDGSPRNVIGSIVVLGMGANAQPYAGPVVITGWDGEGGGVADLDDAAQIVVQVTHRRITKGLAAGEEGLCNLAELIRTEPNPGIEIYVGGERL